MLARKMPSTFRKLRHISNRGTEYWLEFLAHFTEYCWYRVSSGNMNGISVFDLDNSITGWHIRHKDAGVEFPSLEATQPQECDDWEETPPTLNEITEQLADPRASPEHAYILSSLGKAIKDPLLALFWADELTAREVMLLSGMSLLEWDTYQSSELLRVQNGKA